MPHGNWPHRSIIQLSLIGSAHGSQVVTNHHFQVGSARETTLISDTLARAAALELANDWLAGAKPSFVATRPPDYTLTMVRAQVLERPGRVNARLTPSEITAISTPAGSGAGNAEDVTTAGVIRWRTAIANKSSRGRSYVGPLATIMYANGRLEAVMVTTLTTYANAVKSTWAVGGSDYNDFGLTIYSRPYDYQEYGYVRGKGSARTFYWPPDYDGNATNVEDFAVDPILRNQRRRQIGVGA